MQGWAGAGSGEAVNCHKSFGHVKIRERGKSLNETIVLI